MYAVIRLLLFKTPREKKKMKKLMFATTGLFSGVRIAHRNYDESFYGATALKQKTRDSDGTAVTQSDSASVAGRSSCARSIDVIV